MSPGPSIEALVFDLGGVIVPHDNDVLYDRLASRCRATGALERIVAEAPDDRVGTGETPIPALHRRFVDELGYEGGWEVFTRDFCCHLGLDARMLDLVNRLAHANRVMLFSNTNQVHWDHVNGLSGGALARLEAYLSHEIGAVKPHLRAFDLVAERAGIEPSRALFIDDRIDNVEAARLAGYQAEQFTDQTALEALLRGRGVRWTS
jgi:putative hydrolase of the HAD superfamily